MLDVELKRRILDLRPDLTPGTIQNWSTGISGCTRQTKEGAMRNMLTYAKSGRPMPWEIKETNKSEPASSSDET